MEEIAPRSRVDDSTHAVRRILIATGLVLTVLLLIAVAIYAGAFIMLAPMMQ